MKYLADALWLCCFALIGSGLWMIYHPAALIFLGLCCASVAIGQSAIEKMVRRQ